MRYLHSKTIMISNCFRSRWCGRSTPRAPRINSSGLITWMRYSKYGRICALVWSSPSLTKPPMILYQFSNDCLLNHNLFIINQLLTLKTSCLNLLLEIVLLDECLTFTLNLFHSSLQFTPSGLQCFYQRFYGTDEKVFINLI